MIFDTLKNCELYYGCHDGFKLGFDFIKKVIDENTEVGKYEIDGKRVWASVQAYDPKEDSEKFEAHKNYIDIQFIVSGKEYMECAAIATCEQTDEYNPEKDVVHYRALGERVRLECDEKSFAIFFPEDIHKPGVVLVEGTAVKKVVVKVHI
ncbi:MAG: YhcH/YjgK/YiaL family protein [Oscillospiraceae bacterium]|nr:YhcH/YjgK/YiaL family protein [Oscillospiraceae bacterium]